MEDASPLTFTDFLEKMKDPKAADLVRSIKSFIASFKTANASADEVGTQVQQFLSSCDASFRAHPLWAGSNEAELGAAGEGLEKYVMTKLYDKVFRIAPEDREGDEILALHMRALKFLRPEHLDIPDYFRTDAQWTLAQKELQKINSYKAPRDKLICILNCCRVISNLLNIKSSVPAGADDFFPVLVYVVIRTNPPNFKSNLEYIRRFRAESRLVSEASYFYTNMVSAAAFVELINPDQFTIDRDEFLAHMAAAGVPLETLQPPVASVPVASSPGNPAVPSQPQAGWVAGSLPPSFSSLSRHQAGGSAVSLLPGLPPLVTKRTVAELEAEGVGLLVDAEGRGELRGAHRFLYASAGDLTVSDVEALLVSYKELVLRYEALARAVNRQEDIDVASVLQISVPPAFAPQHRQPDGEDAGIQVSTISDDGPPPCAGPEHEESVEVVGDAQEVRRSVAEAPRQQQAQEEAYAEGEANLSAVAEDVAPQEVNALVEMINGKEVAQADAALAETSAPQQERFNVLESELSNVAVDSGPPEDYVEVVQEVEDEAENAVASREPSALQEETAEHRQKSPTEQDEAPGTPRVNEPQGVLFEGGEADPSGSGDQGTPAEPAGAKGSERADAAVSELSSSLEMAPALQEVLLLGMERAQLPLPGALEGTAAPMAEDPTSTDLLSFPGDLPEGMMANIDADKSGDSGATPASEVQATASLI